MKQCVSFLFVLIAYAAAGQNNWKSELLRLLDHSVDSINASRTNGAALCLDSIDVKLSDLETKGWPSSPRRSVLMVLRKASDAGRQAVELVELEKQLGDCGKMEYTPLKSIVPPTWPESDLVNAEMNIDTKARKDDSDLEVAIKLSRSLQREFMLNTRLIDRLRYESDMESLKYLQRVAQRIDSTQYFQLFTVNEKLCKTARSQIELHCGEVKWKYQSQVNAIKIRFRKQWKNLRPAKSSNGSSFARSIQSNSLTQ